MSHRTTLEGAIEALQDQGITDFLADLRKQAASARETIKDAPIRINHQLGIELTVFEHLV